MQEDKEKSLNYSSKKVEIIGIYYLYVVKVTYMQRPVSTLNQTSDPLRESNSVRPI